MSAQRNISRGRTVLFSYLALVEDVDSLPTTAKDLGVILVDGPLRIANGRNILDHDNMIRMLAFSLLLAFSGHFRRLVKQPVGIDHVIDDAALADLLRLELGFGGEVVSVVVAEMVVGGDGEGFYARVH